MDAALESRFDQLLRRHAELRAALSGAGLGGAEFAKLSKEYSELSPIVEVIAALRQAQSEMESATEMAAAADDPEIKAMAEEELLGGPLEPTNEFYAIAKIAAIKLCAAYRRQYGADFISVMPTNVYGLGDNYHRQDSHVIAGLMRRLQEAKQSASPTVAVWGTGTPQREFIFADDLADACIFVMENYSAEAHLNIGSGEEITTAALSRLIADVVGYGGTLVFDASRPDGTPRKLLDVGKLTALGWTSRTPLRTGLERSYADFNARGEGR